MARKMRWPLCVPLLTALPASAPLAGQALDGGGRDRFSVDSSLARQGKHVWRHRRCDECHTIGGGEATGPDLAHVVDRRDVNWLRRWLKETDRMLQKDSLALSLLVAYRGMLMPTHDLSDFDVDALIHYLARESQKRR